jgi:hypothetical protein
MCAAKMKGGYDTAAGPAVKRLDLVASSPHLPEHGARATLRTTRPLASGSCRVRAKQGHPEFALDLVDTACERRLSEREVPRLWRNNCDDTPRIGARTFDVRINELRFWAIQLSSCDSEPH